ncbi:MAG: NUDIX domain-containing protein [Gammaproteobacteria bacterium]
MPAEPEDRFAINVLENSNNEILLLKRSPRARLGPGLWGFPAGHIEDGESPEDCAWRELNEEIGRNFESEIIARLDPMRDTFYGGIYEIHLFHHRWIGGSVHLNAEHTDHVWVGKETFRDYDVMDGIDEDIFYLGIWPVEYLNAAKLP